MTPFETAKLIHVSCAAISIGAFVARFPLALRGSPAMHGRWVRIAPHVNDSLLLAAALVMLALAGIDPLALDWLRVKIVALGGYIVLGALALRPTFGRRTRLIAFALAVLTFGYIVCVALTRSPLGPIAFLGR